MCQAETVVCLVSEEGDLASWEESSLCKVLHKALAGRARKEVQWVSGTCTPATPTKIDHFHQSYEPSAT